MALHSFFYFDFFPTAFAIYFLFIINLNWVPDNQDNSSSVLLSTLFCQNYFILYTLFPTETDPLEQLLSGDKADKVSNVNAAIEELPLFSL